MTKTKRVADRYNYDMQKTALYRHYDSAGSLLYVGITNSVIGRTGHHVSSSTWIEDVRTITLEWFDSRADALDAEDSAIFSENPAWNTLGTRPPEEHLDPKARRGAELALEIIASKHPIPITKDEISRAVDWRVRSEVSISRGVANLLSEGRIRPQRNRWGRAAYVANDNHSAQQVAA